MNEQPFGAGKEPGEQGTIEWLMERNGFTTCSNFKHVIDKQKSGKPGAARQKYLMQVVRERVSGKPTPHFETQAMTGGSELEPMGRMAFEALTGIMVMQTGFHKHPTIPFIGGSPDGLIDDDGGLELKCPWPSSGVHLQTLLTGMPESHIPQIQGLMMVF